METLVCWITKVPNVIWSAIIASLLTFTGVLWTNKGNEKRQAALLEHEKLKFQSEQQLALKKEVFLNVAGSFANVLGVLPKLIDLEFSQKEIESQMENHRGIVAKAYLAAKENTVAEILNYSSETAEVFVSLMKERSVLLDHKKAIELCRSTIDDANNEKNRIVSMMKEFNFQGRSDQTVFDYLKQNYEIQDKIVNDNMERKNNLETILNPKYLEFAKKCVNEHSRLLSLAPPMTIALRKELDNDRESEVFVNAINENIQRMNSVFNDIFKK